MTTSESEWDLEAAEYVLGTQSEENTRVFDVLYKVDGDWKRRVHYWQARLDPMHAATPSVQPPRRVLAKVLASIEGAPPEAFVKSVNIESDRAKSDLVEPDFIQPVRINSDYIEPDFIQPVRVDSDFTEADFIESDRIEPDRIELDRIEPDRIELDRIEPDRIEPDRIESDRIESDRIELDRIESDRIESELSANDSQSISLEETLTINTTPNNPDRHPQSSISNTLEPWKERARYWKLTSLVALVAIAGLLTVGPDYLARQWQSDEAARTIAVLQNDSNAPLWLISHTPDHTITVSVVGEPELSSQQSHQLWVVLPEDAGVQSVGLLPSAAGETVTLELPLSLNEVGEFVVSLEKSGGAAGVEHGPIVTRTLIIQDPVEPGA